MSTTNIILVTGGSGFVASHLIIQLLEAGNVVRATLRKASREQAVRETLQPHITTEANTRLSFVVADLASDDGWEDAIRGCNYVHHVASPFPASQPKNEDELIRPAREGTLRVLRHSRDAGVKRVIMTSSFAAVGYGYKDLPTSFTEENWSILDSKVEVPAYHKSKTLAERAAWEFVEKEGNGLEIAVVNPTGIFGPVLGPDVATSVGLLKSMMEGKMAACPQLYFGVVDVRDVADLHIKAMLADEAKGKRFLALCDGDAVSLKNVADIARRSQPASAARLPKWELPNTAVKFIALFNSQLASVKAEVGVIKKVDNSRAKTLGWKPRTVEECISDTAASLVKQGIVQAP